MHWNTSEEKIVTLFANRRRLLYYILIPRQPKYLPENRVICAGVCGYKTSEARSLFSKRLSARYSKSVVLVRLTFHFIVSKIPLFSMPFTHSLFVDYGPIECTHVKISHLVTSLPTSRQQDVFALLGTTLSKLSDLLQGCSDKSVTCLI
jgi:hypothetical protein